MSWKPGGVAAAAQQPWMHLPDEPQRQRQLIQSLEAEYHGVDVVRELADIVHGLASLGLRLESQKVGERGLRAFDLGAEHRLFAHIHVEEELLARQQNGNAVELSERALRRDQLRRQAEDVERRIGR